MLKFKKEYNLKIVSLLSAVVFLLNTTVYAIGLSDAFSLRVPLAGNNQRLIMARNATDRRQFVKKATLFTGGLLLFGSLPSDTRTELSFSDYISNHRRPQQGPMHKKLTVKFLKDLEYEARSNPVALRTLLSLVPNLEALVESKAESKEDKKLRMVSLQILFELFTERFAFIHDTLPMLQIFERLTPSLIELMKENLIVPDAMKRYRYSHLEWFADRKYLFAIKALKYVYETETKDSEMWYKAAIPLNRILMHKILEKDNKERVYIYDVLSPLLTPDINLRIQLRKVLFNGNAEKQYKFIKKHPEFGYIILHSSSKKELLDKIKNDAGVSKDLRLYALGLLLDFVLYKEEIPGFAKEILDKEDWYRIAKEFVDPSRINKFQTARDIFKGDSILNQARLSTHILAVLLSMDTSPLISKEEAVIEIAGNIMEAGFDCYTEGAIEAFTMNINRLSETPYLFLSTWSHEITHPLLSRKGFDSGFQNISAMHEFLCDMASFKFLQQQIDNKDILDKLIKKIRLKYKYEECLNEWNKLGVNADFETTHIPARAFLEKITREHPEGVDWATLFAIGVELAVEMKKELSSSEEFYASFAKYALEVQKRYKIMIETLNSTLKPTDMIKDFLAEGSNVIIFGEMHDKYQHRAVIKDIIDSLGDGEVDYLALELNSRLQNDFDKALEKEDRKELCKLVESVFQSTSMYKKVINAYVDILLSAHEKGIKIACVDPRGNNMMGQDTGYDGFVTVKGKRKPVDETMADNVLNLKGTVLFLVGQYHAMNNYYIRYSKIYNVPPFHDLPSAGSIIKKRNPSAKIVLQHSVDEMLKYWTKTDTLVSSLNLNNPIAIDKLESSMFSNMPLSSFRKETFGKSGDAVIFHPSEKIKNPEDSPIDFNMLAIPVLQKFRDLLKFI